MPDLNGVLLVSDFDGTLIGPDLTVSKEGLAALRRFTAEGGRFAVATGRAWAAFAPRVGELPTDCPTILYNGAELFDFGSDRSIESFPLCPETAGRLANLLSDLPEVGGEAYFGREMLRLQPNAFTDLHRSRVGDYGRDGTLAELRELNEPLLKVLLLGNRDSLEQARERLERRCPGEYAVFFSADWLLEIVRVGVDKGAMVRRLAERLEIAPDRVFCVGDNENDLPMLRLSRIPFAPCDCAEAVRVSGARLLRESGLCIADAVAELEALFDA